MKNIAIIKISSKGQIVIPQEMRDDLKEGDKLVMIKNNEQIILKKADKFSKAFKEDLEFAKRTEDAWKRYEKGKFREVNFEDFIEQIKSR